MVKIRRRDQRGHANHGWLNTYHSFSFADYYDPANMGFRSLRVINEDWVEPGHGFGTHPHNDMEILTYVLEGALEHKDSMGNGSVIRPGELQRMSAGTGVRHSEYNQSKSDPVHLLQIWILPEERGLNPEYEQRAFPESGRDGRLQLVASPDGKEGSLRIHQDAKLFLGKVNGKPIEYALDSARHAWVQVARGEINLNGNHLEAGDGAAITGESQLALSSNGSSSSAEVLLFDLA